MKKLSILFFLISITSATSVFSQNTELYSQVICPAHQSGAVTTVLVEQKLASSYVKIACERKYRFETIVSDIDKMLYGKMQTNSELQDLKIIIPRDADNAYFISLELNQEGDNYYLPLNSRDGIQKDGATLNIPHKLHFSRLSQDKKTFKEFSKHPNSVEPVVAHEYGHYLFHKNFMPYLIQYLTPMIPRSLDPNTRFVEEQVFGLAQQYMTAINELLADVLAVIYTGDSEAVMKSLRMTGMIQGNETFRQSVIMRSFSNHENSFDYSTRKLRNYPFEAPSQTSQGSSHPMYSVFLEAHNILGPVRYHVYKYFLDNPEYMKNPGDAFTKISIALLQKFLKLSKEDLFEQVKLRYFNPSLEFETINTYFIDELNNL
jgi:hypothetical protein